MIVLSLPSILEEKIPVEVEAIEYRLDLFKKIDFEHLKIICQQSNIPIILTVRSKSHGGAFDGHLNEYLSLLEKLAEIKPDYLDLEMDLPKDFIEIIKKNHPEVKIILSYHQFFSSIVKLKKKFAEMTKINADIYKLAMTVDSSLDACEILLFLKQQRNHKNIACIPMGEKGSFARIISKKFGNKLNFCALKDHLTAPGQLEVHELIDIYRIYNLNPSTTLYALLGDPVEKSIGHIFHNHYFQQHHMDAIYVKIPVKKEEFVLIMGLLSQLDFNGLSITMPLKEMAGSFINSLKSINTLKKIHHDWVGISTDGYGAFKALEEKIKNKKSVLILGAGGSAKSIAAEFIEKGFHVIMINREQFMADWPDFEIIINTLPGQAFLDHHNLVQKLFEILNSDSICLDIVYHQKTLFQSITEKKKALLISGFDMFYHQALQQQQFWHYEQKKIEP